MIRARARYRVALNVPGKPLLICDVGPWRDHPTVTNDAEAVVAELAGLGLLPAGRRLFYEDSMHQVDELLVCAGRFAGFAPGPATELMTADSCSWCHHINVTAVATCELCGHDAHRPRAACTCAQCRPGGCT